MVRIVEKRDVTYTDFGGRASKAEIDKLVKKWENMTYEPRKIVAVYRGRDRTLFVWERVDGKKI